MRKIIFQMMVSLDGYYEGLKREIDWHNVDNEFNEFAISFLNSLDFLIFGRITYELMASYWPTPDALTDDPIVAERMNNLRKIVISRTLDKAEWNNTRLIRENITEELVKLKQQKGKDIAIFGSSDLAVSLIKANLIDEYRIMINPIVLGNGKTLFKGISDRLKLKLSKSKTFNSGNVMLYYQNKN
jgi:dihydrofolate reductase